MSESKLNNTATETGTGAWRPVDTEPNLVKLGKSGCRFLSVIRKDQVGSAEVRLHEHCN